MNMRAALLSLPMLMLLAAPTEAQAQTRFYLSTDRVFAPGQQPKVKVEARGVEALQMRLYRIADPAEYFDHQADLHRPKEQVKEPQHSTLGLLRRGAQRGLHRMLNDARSRFRQPARDTIKQAAPKLHDAAIKGAWPRPVAKVVPLLDGHELLDLWEQDLPKGESWRYGDINIPVSKPGAYLVEATAKGQIAHTVLLVTDVALVTKQSASKLLVWAVDPASGDPRPGTDVTVKVRGKVRGENKTDGSGLVRFDLGRASTPVVYGKNGASFTLLDPRFYPANVPAPKVYVYTERPVYRPGQTVYVKGFARNITDEKYVLPGEAKVELEVVDPKGDQWTKMETTLSALGGFTSEFTLPPEPAFGTWRVFAIINGERHKGEFKILEFIKPEVRLGIRLGRTAVRSGETVTGDVVGEYFFGAPYPNAEVKITVSRTRFYVPWYVDADYSWYYSDAEYRNTERETVQETTCKLDEKGECTFSFQTKAQSEDFTYVVQAAARDPKGKTIIGQSRLSVTRAAFRLEVDQSKIVVAPGETQELRVKAIDYEGQPVQTAVQVVVKADRVGADGQPETVEVLDQSFKTEKDGIARIELDPSRGGYYQVVATATDDQGNKVSGEGFLFAAEDGTGIPNAPTDLQLVTDRRSYFAGDTALVLILAPAPTTSVLFSVEGGDLYHAEVLKTSHHATLAKVKIGEKQTPNFFLSASCVLGGQLYLRHRSVIVPPREKLLSVEVAPDRPRAEPGEKVSFTVHVTDYQGNAVAGAEVALGIVDEAIYAISPEIAVPIQSFFHHRKRNDVRTTDSISFRFFGSSRGLETAALDAGNPFAFGSLKPQEDDRKVFKDTAGWFGALVTGADGKATAEVTLPDNLTAWRATARVATKDTAVGSGTGKVVARKPVVVRVAMPPRVSEGDQGAGSLLVQNLTGGAATFDSKLELSAGEGDAKIEVTFADPGKLTGLSVGDGQLARIPFSYVASGSGSVKLAANTAGSGQSDTLRSKLEVTPWATPRVVTANGQTSGGKPTTKHTLTLPEGVAGATLKVDAYLSTLGAVRAALPYLIAFPYGCTEQTMSRFGPLLDAQASFDRLKIPLEQKDEVPSMIAAGVSRLSALQHRDGGWGWWEKDQSDLWMTAWVVAGLGRAKQLGFEITTDRIDGGINRLTQMLGSGRAGPARRAFALYALSLHGVHKPAMIKKLVEEASQSKLPAIALAYLALAAQDPADLDTVQTLLLSAGKVDEQGRRSWCEAEYAGPDEHPVECTAVALSALVKLKAEPGVITATEAWLMARFDGERFGTTRQTAAVVRALSAAATVTTGEAAELTVRVGGQAIGTQKIDVSAPAAPLTFKAPDTVSGDVTVEVEQKGGPTTFHTVSLRGLERSEAFAPMSEGGVTVRRSFFSLKGTSGSYEMGKSLEEFTEGEALLVRLQIESKGKLRHVMVEDPRAAGLEPILRDGAMQVKRVRLRPRGVHRAHREGKSAFFVGNLRKGKTELFYLARATLAGEYKVPPVRVEAMYLPGKHHARSSSTKIGVKAR